MLVDSSCSTTDLSCSTMKEDGLPEGVLFEIFLKLPWKSINRCKCVSKVWLSIISDPNFMKKKFKTLFIKPKPWVIFSNHVIPNQHHPSDIKIPSKLFHTQFMSSGNELSGYDGFSFNFLRKSYGSDAQHHMLHVLASSNGLVLCSVVNYSKESMDYFVCNPITNESVSLPPPGKGVGKFLHGLLCETYSSSSEIVWVSAFKVMRTGTALDNNTGVEVEIYYSELDEWRTYSVEYDQPRNYVGSENSKCNVITHNGVVYWLEGYTSKVVAYDLNINNYECGTHHCTALDSPMVISHNVYDPYRKSECLWVSEDYVCYGQIQKNSLRTWVLMEDDVEKYVWKLRYQIDLPDFNSRKTSIMGFSPLDRDVVILDCGKQILLFDATTGTHQEVLQRLCVPPSKNKNSFKVQHGYSPFIVQPTLTTIFKGRK